MSASVQAQSCLLRSLFQRVNGSLGSVMSEPNISHNSAPSLPVSLVDGALRWHNAVLTQVQTGRNYILPHVIKCKFKVIKRHQCVKLVQKHLTPPMEPYLIDQHASSVTGIIVFRHLTGSECKKSEDLHIRAGKGCSSRTA